MFTNKAVRRLLIWCTHSVELALMSGSALAQLCPAVTTSAAAGSPPVIWNACQATTPAVPDCSPRFRQRGDHSFPSPGQPPATGDGRLPTFDSGSHRARFSARRFLRHAAGQFLLHTLHRGLLHFLSGVLRTHAGGAGLLLSRQGSITQTAAPLGLLRPDSGRSLADCSAREEL